MPVNHLREARCGGPEGRSCGSFLTHFLGWGEASELIFLSGWCLVNISCHSPCIFKSASRVLCWEDGDSSSFDEYREWPVPYSSYVLGLQWITASTRSTALPSAPHAMAARVCVKEFVRCGLEKSESQEKGSLTLKISVPSEPTTAP